MPIGSVGPGGRMNRGGVGERTGPARKLAQSKADLKNVTCLSSVTELLRFAFELPPYWGVWPTVDRLPNMTAECIGTENSL